MQADKLLLAVSVLCFFLASMSFVLMPIESLEIVPGMLFWGGILGGIALQVVLAMRRKAFYTRENAKKMPRLPIGLLAFGSNQWAKIADYSMGISFVLMILAFVITKGTGVWCFVLIATTLFAFCLHCILNGRIFFHVVNQKKIRRALDQKGKFMR